MQIYLNIFGSRNLSYYVSVESWKEQHLFESEIFCNIINAFTVTFDQFNASLLN